MDTEIGINQTYLSDEYAVKFQNIMAGKDDACSFPFEHFELKDFITSKQFLEGVQSELEKISYIRKDTDLYSLYQSEDLVMYDEEKYPNLALFRKFFKTEVRDWLMRLSGLQFTDNVAITSSKYEYCDTLLAHDDQLDDRSFAFVLYLTPNWQPDSGGQLVLYTSDEQLNPVSPAKMLSADYNKLVLFKVSDRSWHMVNEVVTPDAKRVSLHGWFHCQNCNVRPRISTPPSSSRRVAGGRNALELNDIMKCINPLYVLSTENREQIQKMMEEDSEVYLKDFLKNPMYSELLSELDHMDFVSTGPDNKRNIYSLRDGIPENSILGGIKQVFISEAMAVLLTQWTSLPFHPLETDFDPSYAFQVAFDIYKVNRRCFTMIDDHIIAEEGKDGCVLEFKLFILSSEWSEDYGGFFSYVDKEDGDEILRVCPEANCAALVFRTTDTIPFLKYVNCKANKSCYYVIDCKFYSKKVHMFIASSNSDDGNETLEPGCSKE